MPYVKTTEMSHEEWLKSRQRGVGSSDVAAILGLNPYKTALEVYNEKIASEPPIEDVTPASEFGIKLEQIVADTYSERTGRKVIRDNKIRIHPEFPHLICNLDRIILPRDGDDDGRGILEAKTASYHVVRNWETDIPLMYYVQVVHQMAVTSLTWGDMALLVDGRNFRIFPVTRDEEYVEKQNEALNDFWRNHVEKRIPPPAVLADIEKMLSKPGTEVNATAEVAAVVEELRGIRAQRISLEEREEAAEKVIKEYLGTRELLMFNNRTLVTWKTAKSSIAIDTKRLVVEMPEIAEKYEYEKPGSRRFLIKEAK